MVKNRDLNFKYRIICIAIGIVLSFIGLELSLRLLGLGYNLIYKPPANTGSDYRIFCIGESTTWGMGASNPILKGYPHQLEEMLNNNFPNTKIQCFFNQAIGQNTSEILRKLPIYIKKYQPDLLIFMLGTNNWWNLDRSNIFLFNKNKSISNFTLKTLVFLDKFRTWKLLKWIGFSLGLKKESWNYWWPKDINVADVRKFVRDSYGLEIFDKIAEHDIREMIKICKNKIKVIICSYPIGGGKLRIIQREIAKEFNVHFVDNHLYFEKFSDVNEYFSSDGFHPNDKGYKLVAENIYNCIVENKLIK